MHQQKKIATAAVLAATATVIGAFGAHYLKEKFTSEQLLSFEIGVRYQFYHALALLAVAIVQHLYPSQVLNYAHRCFVLGTILFSGSIYALNILKFGGAIGLTGLGAVTPIGGLLLIIGWVLVIVAMIKSAKT
jgi:uncharacterized membrane protein YgdD (TMEM256/DUF423 family)